jgi:hypothetical protein
MPEERGRDRDGPMLGSFLPSLLASILAIWRAGSQVGNSEWERFLYARVWCHSSSRFRKPASPGHKNLSKARSLRCCIARWERGLISIYEGDASLLDKENLFSLLQADL